jgi:hypothetical protein
MRSFRIYFLLSALLPTLFVVKLFAELPDITQEQLSNSIMKGEDQIEAFHIKYRLTQGEYSETGELVPDVIIDCIYAHNIGKGHKYLHEKWVKDDLERKYTYDGKKGLKLILKQPDDPGHVYGRIMPKIPDRLDGQAMWKPDLWSGYGFIEGYDLLSNAIRYAGIFEITTEEIDKEELYKASFEVATGEMIKFNDSAGKTRWIEKTNTYIAWFSPQKSFRPVKIARLSGIGGEVRYICNASDFREVNLGILIPYRLERKSIKRRKGRIIEIDTIMINENVSVPSQLEFPPGTYMKNEKWGIEYRAGRGLLTLRLESITKALITHLILGLIVILGFSLFIYSKVTKRKKVKIQG